MWHQMFTMQHQTSHARVVRRARGSQPGKAFIVQSGNNSSTLDTLPVLPAVTEAGAEVELVVSVPLVRLELLVRTVLFQEYTNRKNSGAVFLVSHFPS